MINQNFLPPDYTPESPNDKYMKFEQGENRFRILSKPIIGWEGWKTTEDGKKPIRVRKDESLPAMVKDTKEFWAMSVWNYKVQRVQVLEITQATIKKHIHSLSKNEKWGAPFTYDLVVTRIGEGMDTEYTVTPDPKEDLTKDITEAYSQTKPNLEALYEGGDPFEVVSEEDELVEEALKSFGESDE